MIAPVLLFLSFLVLPHWLLGMILYLWLGYKTKIYIDTECGDAPSGNDLGTIILLSLISPMLLPFVFWEVKGDQIKTVFKNIITNLKSLAENKNS